MGIKINQLPDLTSVAGTDMFPADDSGGTTGKHTLAKVAEYAVNAFEITLGGISRTVKTAIDAIQTLLGSTSISGIGDGTVTGAISSLSSDLAVSVGGVATYVSNAQFANANGIRYEVRGKTLFITINLSRTSGAASLSDFVEIASIPYQIDNNGANNAFFGGCFANSATPYQLRFRPTSGTTHIEFVAANTTAGMVRQIFAFALV